MSADPNYPVGTEAHGSKTSASPSVSVSWTALNYTLHKSGRCGKPGTTKTILDNCTGTLAAGRLLAVMGPSGSGKTSLLNVLADRTPKNSGAALSGEVLINGVPRTQIPGFSLSLPEPEDEAA